MKIDIQKKINFFKNWNTPPYEIFQKLKKIEKKKEDENQ